MIAKDKGLKSKTTIFFKEHERIAMVAFAFTTIFIGASLLVQRERRVYSNPYCVTLFNTEKYSFIPWGDSLMTGTMGSRSVLGGWVLPMVEKINSDANISLAVFNENSLLAISGQTSTDLIRKLRENPPEKKSTHPRVICLSIGGNDLGNALLKISNEKLPPYSPRIYQIVREAKEHYRRNFNEIVTIARSLENTQLLILPIPDLTVTPYVNNLIRKSFAKEQMQNIVRRSIRASLFYFNRCIKNTCDYYKIPYIAYSKHTEELICNEDGFHPNEKGLHYLALAARKKIIFSKNSLK